MLKLLAVIILRTLTDLSFKLAVHRLNFPSRASFFENSVQVMRNPFLWCGIILGVFNILVWCSSLKDFDLSFAYPFLSISYICIIVSGKIFFKEHIDPLKIYGIGCMAVGSALLFLG